MPNEVRTTAHHTSYIHSRHESRITKSKKNLRTPLIRGILNSWRAPARLFRLQNLLYSLYGTRGGHETSRLAVAPSIIPPPSVAAPRRRRCHTTTSSVVLTTPYPSSSLHFSFCLFRLWLGLCLPPHITVSSGAFLSPPHSSMIISSSSLHLLQHLIQNHPTSVSNIRPSHYKPLDLARSRTRDFHSSVALEL